MKTTKTFFLAIAVLLLNVFTTGCIPTVPGGNPTPNPPSDTTVIYHLKNKLVLNLTPTNQVYVGDSIDLDSNAINDIYFIAYNSNYGSAVTDINSIGNAELAMKSISGSDGYIFFLNDIINNTHFTHNRIIFGSHSNGTKTVLVGFRLLQADGYHYGWMQLKMEVIFEGLAPYTLARTIKTTLINYAYKKAPNTPILAGKY